MKTSLRIPCVECGVTEPVDIRLHDHSPKWICSKGHHNHGYFSLDFTIGYKILGKSEYEFSSRQDFSMSIVFSAMAFECEISRLFGKWKGIEAGLRDGTILRDEDIETELRRYGSVSRKIEETCRLMSPEGLDDFVRDRDDLKGAIDNRFPSLRIGSLAEGFQKTVFWPRNRILHFGYTEYTQADAARCYSIASLALGLLNELDKLKCAATFPPAERAH